MTVMGSIHRCQMNRDGSITIAQKDSSDLTLSSLYLRDHCPCPTCRHPDTQQRLVDTFSIPEDIRPDKVEAQGDALRLTWSHGGHVSLYKWDWLEAQRNDSRFPHDLCYFDVTISERTPTMDFEAVMGSDDGVKEWLNHIRTWGFCFVAGCPATSDDTQALIERIAFIRTTHYGKS